MNKWENRSYSIYYVRQVGEKQQSHIWDTGSVKYLTMLLLTDCKTNCRLNLLFFFHLSVDCRFFFAGSWNSAWRYKHTRGEDGGLKVRRRRAEHRAEQEEEEEMEQWQRPGATRGRGSLSVPEIKISPRLFRPCSILIPRLFATSLLTLNCYLWCTVWSFLPIRAQTGSSGFSGGGKQLRTVTQRNNQISSALIKWKILTSIEP